MSIDIKTKNLEQLITEIKKLEHELFVELQRKQEEYFYVIQGKKIRFEEETRKYHKSLATRLHTYLSSAPILNILTAPIIWSCIVPAVVLDLFVSVYHFVCFRIYRIPMVRRENYIVIDRHSLQYLNPIEKLNCIYCGYFNGLIAYVQEIAARTEQYWCPIKHARRMSMIHSRYHKFIEYGNSEHYHERFADLRNEFDDLEERAR